MPISQIHSMQYSIYTHLEQDFGHPLVKSKDVSIINIVFVKPIRYRERKAKKTHNSVTTTV
jgi:hypothetical protein